MASDLEMANIDEIVQSSDESVEYGVMPIPGREHQILDALLNNSWESFERVLDEHKHNINEIFALRLNKEGLTPLLMAMATNTETPFIQRLVEVMPPELLSLTDYRANTALHLWDRRHRDDNRSTLKDVLLARLLLEKCPYIRSFRNVDGVISKLEGVDDIMSKPEPEWWGDVREAIEKGNWNTIEETIARQTAINTFAIMKFGDKIQTPLHYAIEQGRRLSFLNKMKGRYLSFLNKMIEWTPAELLSQTDSKGTTVLHLLAVNHDRRYAKMAKNLVLKNPDLLWYVDEKGWSAIQLATEERNYPMAKCLLSAAMELNREWQWHPIKHTATGYEIYKSLLKSEYYDLAITLLGFNPGIALKNPCLDRLLSGLLSYEHNSSYSLSAYAWSNRERILRNNVQVNLVRSICATVLTASSESDHDVDGERSFRDAFFLAAVNGIVDIVEEILKAYPRAIGFKDEDNHSAFQLAVMYRCDGIFNTLYRYAVIQNNGYEYFEDLLRLKETRTGNNILHLAANKPSDGGKFYLGRRRGPILKMNKEVMWFKQVENFFPIDIRMEQNKQGKTPIQCFVENHRDVFEKEKDLVTSTAQACLTAAVLIVSIAFASGIQVPGGTSDEKGKAGNPNYADKAAFKLFGGSNSISLYFSLGSVLMFLWVFTSRFAADESVIALPYMLILGLYLLIISVVSLIISFASAWFLVFGGENPKYIWGLSLNVAVTIFLFIILPQAPTIYHIVASHISTSFQLGPQPPIISSVWNRFRVPNRVGPQSPITNLSLEEISGLFRCR